MLKCFQRMITVMIELTFNDWRLNDIWIQRKEKYKSK